MKRKKRQAKRKPRRTEAENCESSSGLRNGLKPSSAFSKDHEFAEACVDSCEENVSSDFETVESEAADSETEKSSESDDESSESPDALHLLSPNFVKTTKGMEAVELGGYLYSLNKLAPNGRSYWICRRRHGCSGRLNLDPEGNVTKAIPHNHDPEPEKAEELDFRGKLMNRVKENVLLPVQQIYEEERERFDLEHPGANYLPPFKAVKQSLYRARGMFRVYETGVDIELLAHEYVTLREEPWLICDKVLNLKGKLGRMIVFSDPKSLEMLSLSDEWSMDGTFSASPKNFSQLYSIHYRYEDEVFPAVYALLPAKSKKVYVELFRSLKDAMSSFRLAAFGPRLIHTDFELAAINAIAQELPASEVSGCYFHLVHANLKNVRKYVGKRYKEEPELKATVRKVWALAFLPLSQVNQAFESIRNSCPASDKQRKQYLQYFKKIWMNRRYTTRIWNVRDLRRRTNNDIEAWHRRFNSLLYASAPSFHRLVLEQRRSRILLNALLAGNPSRPPQKKAFVNRDKNLLQAIKEHSRKRLSTDRFLQRCAQILAK